MLGKVCKSIMIEYFALMKHCCIGVLSRVDANVSETLAKLHRLLFCLLWVAAAEYITDS